MKDLIKNNILKLGLKLGLVTATAGLVLGAVYTMTRGPIAREEEKRNQAAMRSVLPSAERFVPAQVPEGHPSIVALAMGHKGEAIVGVDMTVVSQGYGGPITFMVGIDARGVVQGLSVLSHTETPGLGANSTTPWFRERFKGAFGQINIVKQEVEKGQCPNVDAHASATPKGHVSQSNPEYCVQAITGATITSNAVAKGVNEALELFRRLKGEMTQ